MKKINNHFIFSIIWLITAGVFFYQAIASYPQISNQLSQVPMWGGSPDGIPFYSIINALQKSIKDSEKLTFKLNMISGFAALVGFIAQARQYRQNRKS